MKNIFLPRIYENMILLCKYYVCNGCYGIAETADGQHRAQFERPCSVILFARERAQQNRRIDKMIVNNTV